MKSIPDNELIDGLKGKDPACCDQIFIRFFPVILGYIRVKVPDMEDAKDIAQESLIVMCEKAASFRKLNNLTDVKKVLYGIAGNKVGSYRRDKKRLNSFKNELAVHSIEGEDPYADASSIRDNEIHFEIRNYISSLKGQKREIYKLLYEGNYTIKEVCALLDTTNSNVRNQHYRLTQSIMDIVAKYKSGVQTFQITSSILFKLIIPF